MAIDSKGNNHQPKGTPNAGKFAPKAGAMDDSDLGVSAGAAPEYVHNRKKAGRMPTRTIWRSSAPPCPSSRW